MCGQVHKYSGFYLDLYLFIPDLRLEFMIINFLPMTKENKVGSSIQ